jgi:CRP-like cAMP-binding protein
MLRSESSPTVLRFGAEVETYDAGQTIFAEGDAGDVMYGIREGEVDIVIRGKVVETAGPGAFVGEMALIDRQRRSASAVARTTCKLVRIDEQRFQFMTQQTPFFALEVMRTLVRRLRGMDTRL